MPAALEGNSISPTRRSGAACIAPVREGNRNVDDRGGGKFQES